MIELSCSQAKETEKKTPNWPQSLKSRVYNECFTNAVIEVDSTRANKLCNCMLEQMIEQHPDTTELRAIGKTKLKKEFLKKALKCMF